MAKVTKKVKKTMDSKKNQKNGASKKSEMAYSSLRNNVPKIIATFNLVSKSEKLSKDGKGGDIELKFRAYKGLLKLLELGIKSLIQQNLNTYSNKMYFEEILKPSIAKLRAQNATLKAKAIKSMGGKEKYDRTIGKINTYIKTIVSDKKEAAAFKKALKTNKFDGTTEKYKLILNNIKLRNVNSGSIDLLPEIKKRRERLVREKHVIENHSMVIKPLMELLLKEKVLTFNKAKELDNLIKEIVTNGVLNLGDLKAKINLQYGPKDEVFNNGKQFGYKGHIGTIYTETITLGKGKSKTTQIDTGKEYVDNFVKGVRYESNKNKEKLKKEITTPVEKPSKKLFYPVLKGKVFESNIKVFSTLVKMIGNIADEFQDRGIDKSKIDRLLKIGNDLIQIKTIKDKETGKDALLISTYKKKPKKSKTKDVKKLKKLKK